MLRTALSYYDIYISGIQGDPVEVLPWLYIGNAYHASCGDRLSACGISALLNMADSRHDDVTSSTSGVDRKGLCHVNIAVADSCSSDISRCFPQAIDFIGEHCYLSTSSIYHINKRGGHRLTAVSK